MKSREQSTHKWDSYTYKRDTESLFILLPCESMAICEPGNQTPSLLAFSSWIFQPPYYENFQLLISHLVYGFFVIATERTETFHKIHFPLRSFTASMPCFPFHVFLLICIQIPLLARSRWTIQMWLCWRYGNNKRRGRKQKWDHTAKTVFIHLCLESPRRAPACLPAPSMGRSQLSPPHLDAPFFMPGFL